jgi:hypothetical protein
MEPQSKSIFPFLDLPPELRNTFYKVLLVAPGPVEGHYCPRLFRYHDGMSFPQPRPSTTNFLLVNRQINVEATRLLWAENSWRFNFTSDRSGFYLEFLHRSRMEMLRIVHLDMGVSLTMNSHSWTFIALSVECFIRQAKCLEFLSLEVEYFCFDALRNGLWLRDCVAGVSNLYRLLSAAVHDHQTLNRASCKEPFREAPIKAAWQGETGHFDLVLTSDMTKEREAEHSLDLDAETQFLWAFDLGTMYSWPN